MKAELIITEDDFVDTIGKAQVARFITGNADVLDEASVEGVVMNMPKVVANKIRKMTPDGFNVSCIEMDFELSGKVFGCGIGGTVNVQFSPVKKES